MHPNDGGAVDPYPYLRKAQPLIFYARPGAEVSLSVAGTIVSVAGGMLQLKASRVQLDSSKPIKIKRSLVLSIADDANVTTDLAGVAVGLEALLPGLGATVYTVPVRATLAAQRGDAAVLTASRIVLR